MGVSWLRTALANLDAIGNTIARDNPVAARETVQRIVSAIDALAENPQLDISRPGRVAGTRELVVTPNYLVPYRIKNSTLEVLRVMHARHALAGSVAVRDRGAREKALLFEPLDPNAKTIRAMKEARKGKFQRFERVEELMIELKAKV